MIYTKDKIIKDMNEGGEREWCRAEALHHED
jgi:hypothetical protein